MKRVFSLFIALAMILSVGTLVLLVGADYVPSVQHGHEPVIIPPSIPEEELPDDYDPDDEIVGIISGGEDENIYVRESELVVISLNRAYEIIDDDSHEESIIEKSDKLVQEHEKLKKSVPDRIPGVDQAAKKLGFESPKYNIGNIFELYVEHDLSADDDAIHVVFKNDIGAVKGSLIVAHCVGDEWVIVDDEKVIFEDDKILVEFDELCPVVFISVEEDSEETTNTVCNCDGDCDGDCGCDYCGEKIIEKTGRAWIWVAIILMVILVGAGVAVFVLWKKGMIRFEMDFDKN